MINRQTLVDASKAGPVRVHMNDGASFDIPSPEMAIVSDIAAHVLTRNAEGKFQTRILALVCMTAIEPLSHVA